MTQTTDTAPVGGTEAEEATMIDTATLVWHPSLSGGRWTEVHGHWITETRFCGIVVQCLGPDVNDVRSFGLPMRQHPGLAADLESAIADAASCDHPVH